MVAKENMSMLKITTGRLELIAGTQELARANIFNSTEFERLLDARVPDEWPPPLSDMDSMKWFERYLLEHPDSIGWVTWYFILRTDDLGERVAIGNGGFKGKPDSDGTVEVGYSILEEFQRAGYATEAAKGLVSWAFEHEEVNRVIAETFPALVGSIGVLENIGLVFIGKGSEEGTIRYAITRREFEG